MFNIELCKLSDLDRVYDVYKKTIANMRNNGLFQWDTNVYPLKKDIQNDIENGDLYKITNKQAMIGAFCVSDNLSYDYKYLPWHFGGNVLELCRIAIYPEFQNMGISAKIFEFIYSNFVPKAYTALRWDNAENNIISLKMSEKQAEHKVGLCQHGSSDINYVCFEKRLIDSCPLLPIKMQAAYRFNDQTPWGGKKLKEMFNKNIPSDVCGESLEISAIPSLESSDESGLLLTELVSKYNQNLVGKQSYTNFPLLLKFIDAKDLLSIQVHPNDEYANINENGKYGKEEAWVILSCEPNSKIVYGLKENLSKEELNACLRSGSSPEKLVEFVKVKPGDIYYIAPGTVHALGTGIVVYEIQQSSDVTYRMWDWARKDKNGNMRELHIEDSIECINYEAELLMGFMPNEQGKHKIVNGDAFNLYCVNVFDNEPVENDKHSFSMLTTLNDVKILIDKHSIALKAGQSVLIPANCNNYVLSGKATVLIAKPK